MSALGEHQQAWQDLAAELAVEPGLEPVRAAWAAALAQAEGDAGNADAPKPVRQSAKRRLAALRDREAAVAALCRRQETLATLAEARAALTENPPRAASAKVSLRRAQKLAGDESEEAFKFELERALADLHALLGPDWEGAEQALLALESALAENRADDAAAQAAEAALADLPGEARGAALRARLVAGRARLAALRFDWAPLEKAVQAALTAAGGGRVGEVRDALRKAEEALAAAPELPARAAQEERLRHVRAWLEDQFDWKGLDEAVRAAEDLHRKEWAPEAQKAHDEADALLRGAPAGPRRDGLRQRLEPVNHWLDKTDFNLWAQVERAAAQVEEFFQRREEGRAGQLQQQLASLLTQLARVKDARERRRCDERLRGLQERLRRPPPPQGAPDGAGLLFVPAAGSRAAPAPGARASTVAAVPEVWLATGEHFVLGRRRECDFVALNLPEHANNRKLNEHVSRHHATLVRGADGAVRLHDGPPGQPSRSGVRLNGAPVAGSAAVELGRTPFVVNLGGYYALAGQWRRGLPPAELARLAAQATPPAEPRPGPGGCLSLGPQEDQPVFRRVLWVLADAVIGADADCDWRLDAPQVPARAVRVLNFAAGRLFLQVLETPVLIDGVARARGALVPVEASVTAQFGNFAVVIHALGGAVAAPR